MAITISQAAEPVDLEWVEGDPISLSFTIESVDWSGSYLSQVRTSADASTVALTLTVSATLDGSDTDFVLSATAVANTLTAGRYAWDMQQVNGVHRMGGTVFVRQRVTR